MKTLYLHIGTHKTGSSAIQKFLLSNKNNLQKNGFYYPTEGSYFYSGENSQSLLAHSMVNQRPNYIKQSVTFDKESCIRDLQRDLEQSNYPNVVISSEHFSLNYSKENTTELKEIFAPFFDQIKIIIYIRRQDLYLESAYNQLIKGAQTIETFEEHARRSMGRNHFEYLEMVSAVFGKENITVRPFEKKQLHNQDVVEDFCNILDFQIAQQKPDSINESLPIEMTEIMRVFNVNLKTYQKQSSFNRFLRSIPFKFDNTKYTLCSPELRKEILAWHAENNVLVAKHYLGRADGVLFYDPEVSKLPLYPGLSNERLAEVSAEIWILQMQAYMHLKKIANFKK